MPDYSLDHVVIAVEDLDAATEHYSALFGRDPSWRGEHPSYGTRNTLFRIDNTYVELLSLGGGKSKDGRWAGELQRFLEKGEGVYALALGTTGIADTARALRDAGLPVQDPADGDGIDQISGATRQWRNAMVPVKATHGARIFFIEHRSPADALPVAAVHADDGGYVRRMDHAVVLSADMEASRHLWADLVGARLALDRTFPERATRILFFRLNDITIEISGGARQTEEGIGKPDRLWGLAWGVDDLDAMCKRLASAGIDVSEPRSGIKPGTRVATAKGRHTHGVATLLIEHSPESFRPESRAPQGAAFDNGAPRRAFNLTALDSVVVATKDIDEAAETWSTVLGLRADQVIDAQNEQLRLARLPAGNAFVALAQPLSPDHRVARTMAERGPGMYAVALEVDDLDAAIRDLRAKGILVSDAEYGAWPGTRVARVNRSAAHDVSLQLVQHLPDVL